MLMRFATRTLNRGILFIVRSDEADSMSVMTEAGLEMEKEMLEGRIKSFERSRRRLGV